MHKRPVAGARVRVSKISSSNTFTATVHAPDHIKQIGTSVHMLLLGTVALRAAAALHAGAVLIEHNFLSGMELDAARSATQMLHSRVDSSPAIVSALPSADETVRACEMLDLLSDDVWQQLPAGLKSVVRKIDALRAELACTTARPLVEDAELQLLRYAPAGHYVRHVDDCGGSNSELSDRPVRRSISLLLYLTPDGWRDEYGGRLRIHATKDKVRVHRPHSSGNGVAEVLSDSTYDVTPTAGSLVLFDSATVPHEVLPTMLERSVVVGWLLEARTAERGGDKRPAGRGRAPTAKHTPTAYATV